MRLFVAIDIDEAIRERLARFLDGVRGFAPAQEVRWVRPESLHLTLKFIGESGPERAQEIQRALGTVRAQTTEFTFKGYGFFPSAKAPRVFWIGVQVGLNFSTLAGAVDHALAPFTTTRERQPYTPHLTLARAGSGRPQGGPGDAPSVRFQKLQEKLARAPEPDFGTMTAREFVLYESKLSPEGAE
ncbi:MAG: RNA 2',3'-cyclic phosphodiesterase, partial [Acidobacteriota bacterium]|nr:RNA 2',3'-cyclic phosphodiesterase [Acidobacteriota bacterium]